MYSDVSCILFDPEEKVLHKQKRKPRMEGTSSPRTLMTSWDYAHPHPSWRMTASKLIKEFRVCRQKERPSLAFLNPLLCGLEGSLKLSHTLRGAVEINQDSG